MKYSTLWKTDMRVWLAYLAIYISVGFIMNAVGQHLEIARFANWWQVITCYGLYLVPASLVVKHRSYFDQYLSGLLFLGVLELGGYSLQTSIPYPGNMIDLVFTERNFALAMTLFFATLLPIGNYALNKLLMGRLKPLVKEHTPSLNTDLRLSKSI